MKKRKLFIWLALVVATLFLFQPPVDAAQYKGPGLFQAPLITQSLERVGVANVWNNGKEFHVELAAAPSWKIKVIHIYVGNGPVPATKKGNLIPGKFNYNLEEFFGDSYELTLNLKDDLGFGWGLPYVNLRPQNIAVHVGMVNMDNGVEEAAWAYTGLASSMEEEVVDMTLYADFPGVGTGWWFTYLLTHPMRGHFRDAPVEGLAFNTGTVSGHTDSSGAFEYFPSESVAFAVGSIPLGSAPADHQVTPYDLVEWGVPYVLLDWADVKDIGALNVARLLQSLDADQDPKKGILLTQTGIDCLEAAAAELALPPLDFRDTGSVDALISRTVEICEPLLVEVSAEEALANLSRGTMTQMRKNVSKVPEMATTKAKLELMPVAVPATRSNGAPYSDGLDYFDENGNFLYNREKAKPLMSVYAQQVPGAYVKDGSDILASDVYAAVSRDDGNTWKRTNLSRAADLSSFTLEDGVTAYYGDVKKPNLVVRDNYALVAWQSKFCKGGKPRYSLPEDHPYYEDDIFGVGGPQRSWDYTEDGFPEVGELPYFCLWIARGTVDPDTADISWRKPERLTSGRRDVYQIAITGVKNAGFGIIWQEDPDGVRPGEAAGPGHGWSGATTSHKTDIWYSFIKWADFANIDNNFVPNGDPEHSFDDPEWTTNRPMPLVPFSMPVRISDNDICNTENMKVELEEDGLTPKLDENGNYIPMMDEEGKHAGTHRYCYEVPKVCESFHLKTSNSPDNPTDKLVCATGADSKGRRRLLDGDTGASRPNINFMSFTKKVGGVEVPSAYAIIAYEETKGVGGGHPVWDDDPDTTHGDEKYKPDMGKNVIFHTFEFDKPDLVSGGEIVNLPERDEFGNLLYLVDEYGELVLDWEGKAQLAYENARRPRMLPQPPGQAIAKSAGGTDTVMILIYKQGESGKGRPSDIFTRRVVNPRTPGANPYSFDNFVCNEWETALNDERICVDGDHNISTVEPTEFWYNPDAEPDAKGDPTKVVKWRQTEESLKHSSGRNPYEDARAHRGILRGDNLFVAYTHTPNWAASRNANDKYDVYIRRSFDGGQTWTTDPKPRAAEGEEVQDDGEICHTLVWKDYNSVSTEEEAKQKDTYEEVVCYEPGEFEPGRNMSQLKNSKFSVIEPRLVGTGGGNKPDALGVCATGLPEDCENKDVFYLSWGTETNIPKAHGDSEEEEIEYEVIEGDLFYTFTQDRGQTFFRQLWEVNPDSAGPNAGETVERWAYLAKGEPNQVEAQLRINPDGTKFYAVWNESGVEGSDCQFSRIMSSAFKRNVGKTEPLEP
jgi:hypothetical protein